MQRGFDALSDFAGGMTLDPAEVDKERGVVIEEWRGRLGAGTRMQQPQIEAIFGPTSRYAQRLPIGTPESLRTFTVKRLRDFYTHALPRQPDGRGGGGRHRIPAEIERLIRQRFGAMPGPRGAARAAGYPIPPHRETRFVTVSDREAQGILGEPDPQAAVPRPRDRSRTTGARSSASLMYADDERAVRRDGAPGRRAVPGRLGRQRYVRAGSAGAGQFRRAREGRRDRARADRADRRRSPASASSASARRSSIADAAVDAGAVRAVCTTSATTTTSDPLAAELLRHYLSRRRYPASSGSCEYARRFLTTITTAEVSAFAREIIHDDNRVVLSSAPEKAGLAPVTQAQLQSALTAGLAATVTAWRDRLDGKALMAKAPSPAR